MIRDICDSPDPPTRPLGPIRGRQVYEGIQRLLGVRDPRSRPASTPIPPSTPARVVPAAPPPNPIPILPLLVPLLPVLPPLGGLYRTERAGQRAVSGAVCPVRALPCHPSVIFPVDGLDGFPAVLVVSGPSRGAPAVRGVWLTLSTAVWPFQPLSGRFGAFPAVLLVFQGTNLYQLGKYP